MDQFLTISEVADRLKLTAQTIYKMIKVGTLPAIRVGSQWRVSEKKINLWLHAQQGRRANGSNG